VLEVLRAGIAGQLVPLGDASPTGTGQSSADVLEVPVAELLTDHARLSAVSEAPRPDDWEQPAPPYLVSCIAANVYGVVHVLRWCFRPGPVEL